MPLKKPNFRGNETSITRSDVVFQISLTFWRNNCILQTVIGHISALIFLHNQFSFSVFAALSFLWKKLLSSAKHTKQKKYWIKKCSKHKYWMGEWKERKEVHKNENWKQPPVARRMQKYKSYRNWLFRAILCKKRADCNWTVPRCFLTFRVHRESSFATQW